MLNPESTTAPTRQVDELHACIVVSAPTGSGKSALFELAIVRLIETRNQDETAMGGNKIVYLAPVKALCSEKYVEWSNKFRPLGLRVAEVTGDSSDLVELRAMENIDLILTTPEKWDAMTRRWKDHQGLVQLVKLFLIDEVHLLNEERRGPTLEAVVSRMKTVEATLNQTEAASQVRFIAVSATIPNIHDIAEWLGQPQRPAKFFKFDDSARPVNLKKIVLGYPLGSKGKAYTFDIILSYKLKEVIIAHANGKPTLIFCTSRKSVQQTCTQLRKNLSFNFTPEQMEKLGEAVGKISDNNLRDLVKHGLAYHHAGLPYSDRRCLEEVFRSGYLPVLISTSTLAMGVNLPAHLVIIKSTEYYVSGEWRSYSESQILQMMGRAGRPQFDSTATAVIMTRDTNKHKYEKLMSGEELVESRLPNYLVEHLNSEIVLGTITDIGVAMNWLRSTFLYVRALKNPKHYGIPHNLTEREIESKLQAMCMRELHALEKYELVATSNFAYSVEPTENGKLMARYYIAFETMKVFMKIEGTEKLPHLLDYLTQCHEFHEVQLRRSERPVLNNLNRNTRKETIRFPIPGKISTKNAKVNVLIQAILGSLQITDPGLLQETTIIMRLADRLLKGLTLYLGRKPHFESLSSALTLHKCVVVKMWENSPQMCRQLPGIGPALGALLVDAGKLNFSDIINSDPRTLERIINRQPPMGNTLQEAAVRMPQYKIDVIVHEQSCSVIAHVRLVNIEEAQYGNMLHKFTLLISTANQVLGKEVISDQTLISKDGLYTVRAYAGKKIISEASDITVTLISSSIVGVDVKTTLKPSTSGDSVVESQLKTSNRQINLSVSKQRSLQLLEKFAFVPTRVNKLSHDNKQSSSNVVSEPLLPAIADPTENIGFPSTSNIQKDPVRDSYTIAHYSPEYDLNFDGLSSNDSLDLPAVNFERNPSSSNVGCAYHNIQGVSADGVHVQPNKPFAVGSVDTIPENLDSSSSDLGFNVDALFGTSENYSPVGQIEPIPLMMPEAVEQPDIICTIDLSSDSNDGMLEITSVGSESGSEQLSDLEEMEEASPLIVRTNEIRAPLLSTCITSSSFRRDIGRGLESIRPITSSSSFNPPSNSICGHEFKFNQYPRKLRFGYEDQSTSQALPITQSTLTRSEVREIIENPFGSSSHTAQNFTFLGDLLPYQHSSLQFDRFSGVDDVASQSEHNFSSASTSFNQNKYYDSVIQYSEGHTQLPPAPQAKRRKKSSASRDDDSGVESIACTHLSDLMAIHEEYRKKLDRF